MKPSYLFVSCFACHAPQKENQYVFSQLRD